MLVAVIVWDLPWSDAHYKGRLYLLGQDEMPTSILIGKYFCAVVYPDLSKSRGRPFYVGGRMLEYWSFR